MSVRTRAIAALALALATGMSAKALAQVHVPDVTGDASPLSALATPSDAVYGDGPVIVAFVDRTDVASEKEIPVLLALAGDGHRCVVKELPLRSPLSVAIARAVMASRSQSAAAALRLELLLAANHPTTQAALDADIHAAKLDAAKLTADAASDAVTQALRHNRELADHLGIAGTPVFITNGGALAGPRSYKTLDIASKTLPPVD